MVSDNIETMLQAARDRSAHGFGLPRHVEQSFRQFLSCGVLENGFARVACRSCQYETLVAFSCKTRGLCPSCDGRRMADTAAYLVDHVWPAMADARQWTLSFPRWLRARLLYQPALVTRVLDLFVRAVRALHRRRARARGLIDADTGAVTAIQRAGSFVNANLHFHTLIPDGVWTADSAGAPRYHALPPPTDEEVTVVATHIVRRVAAVLAEDADHPEPEVDELAHAQIEAVQLPLLPSPPRTPDVPRRPRHRCAWIDGFSLHADTVADAGDRPALERLARYLLRPLVSAARVSQRPDGRVEYRFRHPDPTGRTSWITDGPTFCRRLAALVPPRRSHTVRWHGVFAPRHRFRAHIVPAPPLPTDQPLATDTSVVWTATRRLDWAQLLRRVFGEDVTRCPRCDDHLRVLAFITDPQVTATILDHLGSTPFVPPARGPPSQPALELDLDLGFQHSPELTFDE